MAMSSPPPRPDRAAPIDAPPLPAHAPTPPHPRRDRSGVVAAVVGALGGAIVVTVMFVVVHLWATHRYDQRADAAATARAEAVSVGLAALDARADALLAGRAGTHIVDAADEGIVGPDAEAAVEAATAELAASGDALEEAVGGTIPQEPDRPFWTWEFVVDAPLLEAHAIVAEKTARATERRQGELASARSDLDAAGAALFDTIDDVGAAYEAAHISAQTSVVLDFRDARAAAAAQPIVDEAAADAFAAYAASAEALQRSDTAELAEKAGPLLATRLEIEEYARSIAGGVVLDFDWEQVVAGTGGAQGIGGTATWSTARGGFSTITLSHSVAETWPSANARALVTHEVGHSITSKCWEMFDWEDQAANEEWATAWAISMGHTAPGNGTWAYGYPSQRMIDLAATCR